MLQVDELTLDRGDMRLLENLSFSLYAGECLRIYGANGIGKTTLLRSLCGISRPSGGQIRWSDELANEESMQSIHYLGHQTGMKDALTVKENLQVAARLRGTRDGDVMASAIRRVGLAGIIGRRFQNLSAGQRRRVALASLLMSPAKTWLLDEPFTALDPDGIERVETMITERCESGGCVIFTAHTDAGPLNGAKLLKLDDYRSKEKMKGCMYGDA